MRSFHDGWTDAENELMGVLIEYPHAEKTREAQRYFGDVVLGAVEDCSRVYADQTDCAFSLYGTAVAEDLGLDVAELADIAHAVAMYRYVEDCTWADGASRGKRGRTRTESIERHASALWGLLEPFRRAPESPLVSRFQADAPLHCFPDGAVHECEGRSIARLLDDLLELQTVVMGIREEREDAKPTDGRRGRPESRPAIKALVKRLVDHLRIHDREPDILTADYVRDILQHCGIDYELRTLADLLRQK